jgi:archaemetzincin
MDEHINILVLNDISRNILKYLIKNLSSIFDTEVKVSRNIIIPTILFNKEKDQYDGKKLLKFLTENMTLKEVKGINLALFDRDLFIGSLDYAFGLASPFPKISVISILRLHPHFETDYFSGGLKKRKAGRFPLFVRILSSQEKALYYERILKEAVHGIGHTMGLIHCSQKECIMHPSDIIGDIDSKEKGFCKTCQTYL